MDIPNMGVPARLAARMSMAEQHEYLRSKLSRRTLLRSGAVMQTRRRSTAKS